MERHDNDEICYCAEVTYRKIREALHRGATNVDQIGDITEAGIACGTCIKDLEDILEES